MYSKKLKQYFRNMVIRQANLVNAGLDFDMCKWICLYYSDGLNDAMCITHQYDSYFKTISSDDFEYVFRSIVEYSKGVC